MSYGEYDYDQETKTAWVYQSYDDPQTLVPNEQLRTWIEALKRGETDDGRAVERVCYVFDQKGAAEYNHQALAYANIETWVGDRDDANRFEPEGGSPEFGTETDFGIE